MSGKLVGEVLANAPADLSPSELLILVSIAEQIRSRDEAKRECWPGIGLLCWHTRMTEDGVRKTLQRLAKRGLEVRVSIGTDRRGRPVFAYQGKQTRYRLPEFVDDLNRLGSLTSKDGSSQPASTASETSERQDDGPATVEHAWRDDVPTTDLERQDDPTHQGGTNGPTKAVQEGLTRGDESTALTVSTTVSTTVEAAVALSSVATVTVDEPLADVDENQHRIAVIL